MDTQTQAQTQSDFQPHPATLSVEDWGLIEYKEAEEKQLQYVSELQRGSRGDTLIFCTHPHSVTLGRGTQPGDVFDWQGPIYEIQRGGRATYHGPCQMIAYPIVDLKKHDMDIHKYMRRLENVVVSALGIYGVRAEGGRADETGVWVGDRKMASIGVGVKKWISFHGVAVNLHKDEMAFQGINPCGYSSKQMICLEELNLQKISHQDFQTVFESFFRIQFS
jgi:lipoyl(octanoyl) transferase